jgi:arylformamidase
MPFHIEDLSYPIAHNLPSYPGDPICRFTRAATYEKDGCNLTQITFSSHQGTHLDAPLHFLPEGKSVDQIPLSHLWGRGCCLDLSEKREPHSLIEVSDLLTYKRYFTPEAIVLIHTGWEEVHPDPVFFTQHPSFTMEAAHWLAERKPKLLGLDFPSPSTSNAKEIHQTLLSAGICLVESLKGLKNLTDRDFYFAAVPLPIRGIDGSPVRALAFWPKTTVENGISVRIVSTPQEMIDALTIRDNVFINEQGIDPRIERDSLDKEAMHFIACRHDRALGTARLILSGQVGKIGRLAVLKEARNQGIGSAIIKTIIETGRLIGLKRLYLHSQTQAKKLYLRQGFAVSSEEFLEAGLPHVSMQLTLD